MSLGASGFRLDVADELPDDFIAEVRRAVKAHGGETLLLGEVWEDASNKISYDQRRRYLLGDELDGVMNYPARTAIMDFVRDGDGELFMRRIEQLCCNYPSEMLDNCMNFLSTHDTSRAINDLLVPDPGDRAAQAARTLSEQEYLRGVEMFKLASAIQFAIPGIPCIYYGDEAGMTGFKDPFNRGYFNWQSPNTTLQQFLRELGEARLKNRDILSHGSFRPLFAGEGNIAFLRSSPAGQLLLAVNMTGQKLVVSAGGQEFTLEPWRFVFERL